MLKNFTYPMLRYIMKHKKKKSKLLSGLKITTELGAKIEEPNIKGPEDHPNVINIPTFVKTSRTSWWDRFKLAFPLGFVLVGLIVYIIYLFIKEQIRL